MPEQKQNSSRYPEALPMKTVKIRGNIYMTTGGSGANTGFYAGMDNVIAIDAKMTQESGAQFYGEIRKITSKPFTAMVITHSDLDHVLGCIGFPPGISIIAHEKTKRDMAEMCKNPQFAALNSYLPAEVFLNERELKTNGNVVRLIHFGPGHTGGDIIVLFTSEKVAFTGDLITLGREPLIHRMKGGSSDGLVKNLKAMLTLDADVFVCGHNDPAGKAEIEFLIKSLEEKQKLVGELFEKGKSLEEVKTILKVEERPPLPSGMRFPTLTEVMFLERKENNE
jgi:glyoxylase-like metal-dependent hydrolase (beta-lactamase superfamily II)